MSKNLPSIDFPFYRSNPIELSASQWLVPLAAVGIATWILLGQFAFLSQGLLRLLPSFLFALAPLVGLAIVARKYWTALFRRIHLSDFGWMFAFALLNYAIAIPLGLVAVNFIETETNPGVGGLATQNAEDRLLFFINSIPQLIGEELVTIIPFLAILYFLHSKAGLSRGAAIVVAWIVSAIWFAAIHLPTYNWNILQCLVLIGGARLVLTLAYLKTKNLWVSAGAHIINDWVTFGLVILGASRGVSA